MNAPLNGPTVYAHVVLSLERAESALTDVSYRIQASSRLTKAQRIAYGRQLAGVISDVESVRLWLDGEGHR